MIHYTLLPDKQIKYLKKEYRTRLVIFLLFFLSCAVLIGTISLVPAFILSYLQEKEVLIQTASLRKDDKGIQTGEVVKDLSKSNEMVKRLKEDSGSVVYTGIIQKILGYKPQGLSVKSLNIYFEETTATSTVVAIIQGKSALRETLIDFKNKLETDPLVLNVELPVSDLVKSKDVSYSIKISFMETI